MFHSCVRAFCLPPLGFMWLHVVRSSALLCGGTGPAGECRDRRVEYELDLLPYTIMPKTKEENGEWHTCALVKTVPWPDDGLQPTCLCMANYRFDYRLSLGPAAPGVQENKLVAPRLRLPGPDSGGCEGGRREGYPAELRDYMLEKFHFGTKGWQLAEMCHVSPCTYVRVGLEIGMLKVWQREMDAWGVQGPLDEESDGAMLMQSYSRQSIPPRPDGIPRREFEELVSDFRQLVDMGIGRRARRDLIFRVQCRQPARVFRFLQEVLGECLDDDAVLPIDCRRYPVDIDDWVSRAFELLSEHAPMPSASPRRSPARADPTLPFGMMHAAHVWRDGTWSTAEELIQMGRTDLLPQRARPTLSTGRSSTERPSGKGSGSGPGAMPHSEEDEPDVTGLFQGDVTPRRTWEQLMDLFWEWFEGGRQVGMAVGMVRRFVQARERPNYDSWSLGAVNALGAGIPGSDGIEWSLTPADFYVWATEVEARLFAAFIHDRAQAADAARVGAGEADGVVLMERGRRGGERQRRARRSRSRAPEVRRRRTPVGPASSGSRGPAGNASTRVSTREALRTAPWRSVPPALSSRSNRSGGSNPSSRRPASPRRSEVAGDRAEGSASSSSNLTYVPGPPRDNDDCVDIWRHILGVETSALPRGIEITGGDGPFIPDARADYIRRVLSGFTAEQQALMTLGLMTVLRAMLAELGVILHASSFVDVVAEMPADPGADEDDEDGEGVTLMLQMDMHLDESEALALVQQDVAVVSGVMSRLQDALMGDDRGLSRVRAAHLRARVHRMRLGNFVDRDLADRVEALCVVVEEHGQECLAGGFHAMEAQVAEWTWGWWRVLEPLMVQQLDNPPVESASIQIASSLSTTGGLSGSLGSADLADLDADQAEARRDAAALQHQQELFEEEESRYYQGVEAAVQAELSRAEAKACRDWDDWALWDSMHNSPVRGRKRTFLNVTVSSGAPSSASQSWSVPVDGLAGQQITLSFRTVIEAQDGMDNTRGSGSPDSGATTIPAAVNSSRGCLHRGVFPWSSRSSRLCTRVGVKGTYREKQFRLNMALRPLSSWRLRRSFCRVDLSMFLVVLGWLQGRRCQGMRVLRLPGLLPGLSRVRILPVIREAIQRLQGWLQRALIHCLTNCWPHANR